MRSSGRTFRLMLTALRHASRGKHVLIACPMPEMVAQLWSRLVKIISVDIGLHTVEHDGRMRMIKFKASGGSIQVACRGTTQMELDRFTERYIRGFEYEAILEDYQ